MNPGHGARQGRRRGAAHWLWGFLPLALLLLALVLLGGAGARADVCASSSGPSDQVLARLPLLDPGGADPDGAIQSFTEGDPGAAAGHAIVATGGDDKARALRLSYRLDPGGRARAGVRIKLDRLDASAYDHLELKVRGDPGTGFARALEVGFQRPRPDRPDMIESGSSLVEGISDQWQDVRVPLNRMTGIGSWTGLDELVLAVDSAAHRGALRRDLRRRPRSDPDRSAGTIGV